MYLFHYFTIDLDIVKYLMSSRSKWRPYRTPCVTNSDSHLYVVTYTNFKNSFAKLRLIIRHEKVVENKWR